MADQDNLVEKKLQKLGHRLRRGWAKLHPVTRKQMEAVRAVVRKQWEQRQKKESSQSQATDSDEQGKTQFLQQSISKQSKQKSKSRDHGHSH